MSIRMTSALLASVFLLLASTITVSGQGEPQIICHTQGGRSPLVRDARTLVDVLQVLTVDAIPDQRERNICCPQFWGPKQCFDVLSRDSTTIKICASGGCLACNEVGEYLSQVLAKCIVSVNGQDYVEGQIFLNPESLVNHTYLYITSNNCTASNGALSA
ncbi:hypothetical protein MPTK1_7g07350 [Marchantia polymorpha subsp. ruderalis]|uniref:Uncharacterized protein n=2 Tax=Marchantia polymorpha TaxID=3197 RepID=A0AAF6BX22_MARPO|nr:hypothetical protein MARPO_0076s0059 [Marchantia polymorpha]BBN16556.1 hypothetical protein Mp_7g07350 [Marchantia polymorpha subsp. ruderalis]|eukprot:PTQ34822.1 hypothetical protein MARPO_0076s0059 [Marchantia polymorpha]